MAARALSVVSLLLFISSVSADSSVPTGLLANFQKSPALGVGRRPYFAWIVPAHDAIDDAAQSSYQITVKDAGTNTTTWSSGKIQSNKSTGVRYSGSQSRRPRIVRIRGDLP